MRLGFWNRLAIVAFCVGVPLASFWAITEKVAEYDVLRKSSFSKCQEAAQKFPIGKVYEQMNICREIAYPMSDNDPYRITGWHWRFYLMSFAAIGAVLYAAIWLIVATAKWIWRGRQV